MEYNFFEDYKPNTQKKTKLEVINLLKKRILMFKQIEARLPLEQVEKFGKSKYLQQIVDEMEVVKVKSKKSKSVNVDAIMTI
jgi:hypothetical protein